MENNPFQTIAPSIEGNQALREPQIEAFAKLVAFAGSSSDTDREVGVVLPVGCGKSGLITLCPFAFRAKRTLVVAPGVRIAQQLHNDFDPTRPSMFYQKCSVLSGPPYPEPVEIRGTTTNRGDLDASDVVLTNIQQLQGNENRWLQTLPPDFFDLILLDEAHHNVAASWETLRTRFPSARIVNFSATPMRSDGQLMAGRIIYSYPIFRAIQRGYVKRLKAIVLNPTTLKYIRRDDGREIEVGLEEVCRLGEEDSDFRRSIVTSTETLNTIVDASIRELDRIRTLTGENRLKIIASALNYEHCIQVVAAYRARGKRADYVHSKEDGAANERVMQRLANHELDVIVQVRKLGEGFDHPFLSVAAVFSVFRELSPFVQFVGRIMRAVAQNEPDNPLNQGSVIFHAGANIARRWQDFQQFSQADQEFFDQLLPVENLNFDNANEIAIEPVLRIPPQIQVSSQTTVTLEEIPLLSQDDDARRAFELLQSKGFTAADYQQATTLLRPVPTTRVGERKAARAAIESRVQNEVGKILTSRGVSPGGKNLDKKLFSRTNFVILKSAIDKKFMKHVGMATGSRSEYTQIQLNSISDNFDALVNAAVTEVFNG